MPDPTDRHEFEQPSTPNADEYTYVVKSKGFLKGSDCSLLVNGEAAATLSGPLAASSGEHVAVAWESGPAWTVEQKMTMARTFRDSNRVLASYAVMAPEGVQARLDWSNANVSADLSVTSSKEAELYLRGTHLQLWLDGFLVGESTPVWRDSDTDAGIEARAFVDRTRADARAYALLLLGVGLADRDNMEFSSMLGTKPD